MTKSPRELTFEEIEAEENALTDFQFAVIDAMNEQGLKQADLAKRMGVSRARVSQMLSPEANPTLKLAGRMLRALGLEAGYAMTKQPIPKRVWHWESLLGDIEKQVQAGKLPVAHDMRIFKCTAQRSRGTMAWTNHHANDDYAEERALSDVG